MSLRCTRSISLLISPGSLKSTKLEGEWLASSITISIATWTHVFRCWWVWHLSETSSSIKHTRNANISLECQAEQTHLNTCALQWPRPTTMYGDPIHSPLMSMSRCSVPQRFSLNWEALSLQWMKTTVMKHCSSSSLVFKKKWLREKRDTRWRVSRSKKHGTSIAPTIHLWLTRSSVVC